MKNGIKTNDNYVIKMNVCTVKWKYGYSTYRHLCLRTVQVLRHSVEGLEGEWQGSRVLLCLLCMPECVCE